MACIGPQRDRKGEEKIIFNPKQCMLMTIIMCVHGSHQLAHVFWTGALLGSLNTSFLG